MSVRWHRQEPSKLLVAEKCGVIRMYNIETQRAILSLDAGHCPLMAADWSPSNCSRVGCVAGGDLVIRDVTAARYILPFFFFCDIMVEASPDNTLSILSSIIG